MSLKTPKECILQVSGKTLQEVDSSSSLPWGGLFTSDGSRNKETDTRIGNANSVLHEFYCSVVAKRELSKTAKLSVFKSTFSSDPHLWSSILGDDRKNTAKRTNG